MEIMYDPDFHPSIYPFKLAMHFINLLYLIKYTDWYAACISSCSLLIFLLGIHYPVVNRAITTGALEHMRNYCQRQQLS